MRRAEGFLLRQAGSFLKCGSEYFSTGGVALAFILGAVWVLGGIALLGAVWVLGGVRRCWGVAGQPSKIKNLCMASHFIRTKCI